MWFVPWSIASMVILCGCVRVRENDFRSPAEPWYAIDPSWGERDLRRLGEREIGIQIVGGFAHGGPPD